MPIRQRSGALALTTAVPHDPQLDPTDRPTVSRMVELPINNQSEGRQATCSGPPFRSRIICRIDPKPVGASVNQ